MRDGRVDDYDSRCGAKNTVTIDTHRHGCVWVGSRKALQRLLPGGVLSADNRGSTPMPPRRAQCSFDGSAVKSAFALLLEKVTKPRSAEKGCDINKKND